METLSCPIEGYEDFTITVKTIPEWKVSDHTRYADAVQDAFDSKSLAESDTLDKARWFGSFALCDKVEGFPDEPLDDLPLGVYRWLLNVVYYNNFDKALNPEKN